MFRVFDVHNGAISELQEAKNHLEIVNESMDFVMSLAGNYAIALELLGRNNIPNRLSEPAGGSWCTEILFGLRELRTYYEMQVETLEDQAKD